MDIKQKILKHLIENNSEKFSINSLSKILKIDYKLVHTNVKKLVNEGDLSIEDRGNSKLCYFSGKFNKNVFSVEYERRKELLKNKDFQVIYNRLNKINKQFILIMFGSQIKGNATKNSDIDLMIIANNEEIKEVESGMRLLPYKIHLNSFNYTEFIQMLKSKEFSLVSEAVKNNVVLIGIEDYYRIIENAR